MKLLLSPEARREIASQYEKRPDLLMIVTPTDSGFTRKDGSHMTDLEMLKHIFKNRICVELILDNN